MSETTSAEGRIITEARGALFLIGIDRPRKFNGFTPEMLAGLGHAYRAFEDEADARCGVLYAVGDHFTAGLDLAKVTPLIKSGKPLFPAGALDPFGLRPPFRSKPMVVAVRGWCLTLGIELMLAADMVVAARDTRFSQLEVKRGIMATGGATLRMVERAGWGNAMRYLLTGDEFDAETALRLSFVQELVEPGRDVERAMEIAESIAAQAPLAVQETLANARLALSHGPRVAVEEMGPTQQRLLVSEDAAEGERAFVERRDGTFVGR